jgi:CMP-N-acetylneuraminic acid synthetase
MLEDPFDAVCLLQPTSPFRRAEDIDACIAMLEERGLDAVVSVVPVPAEHNPHWVYFEDDGLLRLATGEDQPIPRRQELPPAFHRDGSVYADWERAERRL